jgi:hypothetical protein
VPDDRTYIRLHDGMPDHPKIEGLSDRAFRLLIDTWCWCSRHLTDGKVPAKVWTKRGTPASRRELTEAGLAEQVGDTILMHDYLEHQRSADEVAEMRAKRAEAGRKGGKAKARNLASAKASAKQVPKQTGSKSVPSTETDTDTATDVAVVPDADASGAPPDPTAQTLVAEWIEHCPERPPGTVVGQTSKHVKAMLDEGIHVDRVRAGLAEWSRKGLHPSALPSVVHEVQVKRSTGPKGEADWMRRRLS